MESRNYITLLELQEAVKSCLESNFPFSFWVTAEISEVSENYSGHCYLELIEKSGRNAVPKAKAKAVIWRSTYGALASYFRAETGSDLAPGMKIMFRASVVYHELYGLSLVISEIDPLYTLGDMERQRQETIRRLQEEGVFEMNAMLEVPPVIQRIAVVSSKNAAGYQDFVNELSKCGFAFHIELFDSFMQGNQTEESVIDALGRICDRLDDFDAVVVIRGGGAVSDLAAFDSYRLCCHIAQFPLPVITGIGHEKDRSVADMVANVSLKTPTAVAAFLNETAAEFEQWLEQSHNDLYNYAVGYIQDQESLLRKAGISLSGVSSSLTTRIELRLERLFADLRAKSLGLLSELKYSVERYSEDITKTPPLILNREAERLSRAGEIARLNDPELLLGRGYSIVRKSGTIIKKASALKKGDMVTIRFADGETQAEIK